MAFTKATKRKAKLRVALAGPAGSGKTVTALQLAKALGGRVALGDTEGESASKYGDLFDFDSESLMDHNPRNYVKLIRQAEAGGYASLIIDSLSHEWMGRGGVLDMVDQAQDKFGAGWKKASPLHQELVDAILNSQVHIIATLRSKMAYESAVGDNGKVKVKKLGMAPVTREGTEYEFDFLFDLSLDGVLTVAKSRAMGVIEVGDSMRRVAYPELFAKLMLWSGSGAEEQAATHDARSMVAAIWKLAKAKGCKTEEFPDWVATVLGEKKPSKDWTADDMARLEDAFQTVESGARG